ncbi:MAG: DUF5615 family PIN-like protein [Armatimonadetes bacterium]|nr:DUF5615 family PIN-like protein [Armatimonadota bacterium]
MKLLLDENLSPRLVSLLADSFELVSDVVTEGLMGQPDEAVANHAIDNGLTIVSKDSDLVEAAVGSNGLQRVIWIRLGNCSTQAVYLLLNSSPIEFQISRRRMMQCWNCPSTPQAAP